MDQKAINLIVDDDNNNQRLDKVVAILLQDFSRMTIKNWINSGNVLLEKKTAEPKTKVYKGQAIVVFPVTEDRHETLAEKIDFVIAYEDEDLLVLTNLAGLLSIQVTEILLALYKMDYFIIYLLWKIYQEGD